MIRAISSGLRFFGLILISDHGSFICSSDIDSPVLIAGQGSFTRIFVASLAGSRSGLGHPLHPHIHEPPADVSGIESNARTHAERWNRSPFCSTENRQSRDL